MAFTFESHKITATQEFRVDKSSEISKKDGLNQDLVNYSLWTKNSFYMFKC